MANLLLNLVHYGDDHVRCHHQSMLHSLGSSCSEAAMLGYGPAWGGGLAGGHQGYQLQCCLQGAGVVAGGGTRGIGCVVLEFRGADDRRGATGSGWVGA